MVPEDVLWLHTYTSPCKKHTQYVCNTSRHTQAIYTSITHTQTYEDRVGGSVIESEGRVGITAVLD